MYITKYYSKTLHNFKLHSIANFNFLVWGMTLNFQVKRLWRNFILLEHISISLHGYWECLNSACETEILEGYI